MMNLKIVLYIVLGMIFFCFTCGSCGLNQFKKPRNLNHFQSSDQSVNTDCKKSDGISNTITFEYYEDEDIRKAREEMNTFLRMSDTEKLMYCQTLKRTRDLLQEKLETTNKTLQEKVHNMKEKVHNMNISLIEKTNECLYYLALIDFNELVKGLLENSYPIWGENRKTGDHSEKIWETIFLNIEDPRIMRLKIELQRYKLTETKFITLVESFLKLRNDNAHHKLSNKGREKTYPELLRIADPDEKVVIKVILQFSYYVDIKDNIVTTYDDVIPKYPRNGVTPKTTSTTINKKDESLLQKVIHDTKQLRNVVYKLRLLIMSSIPAEKFSNEVDIEEELKQIPEITFLSCYMLKNDRTAYILFHNFEDAHTALKHFADMENPLIRKQINFQITAVEHASLCKSKGSSALKVKYLSNAVTGNDEKEDNTATGHHTKLTTSKVTKGKFTFYQYENLEQTLLAYQKKKNNPNVQEVVIIPASSVPSK